MLLWSLVSVNILMELLIIIAGMWAYVKNKSLPALILALALFCFTLTHFTFLYPPAFVSRITLSLRLMSYFGELIALVLLLRSTKKRR
ncbi:TPA: hypothetical protein DIC20_04935 [Candidatus Dependentiae bacterium]|nr:MAG: hypothetical protein US03_C0007G0045 [candidate division TM6 bacterium GW2011_GWF2_36_131]KKQ03013.1 MAG: hypothetical protein US13_C0007G0023 [candidate division TM6 bacterium GW2011_GWE2_36_25]KKQ19570.1 MAG: hypothetical protein US32_C0007G0023 [candidate division TM6 bacterium GW2011_GWA2_36_9]HBR71085.1 hypothetical protein [Candidatus Dependentiae bacterium]HCU01019.1 hypothetical protein [Candidatus Dependentiae bacterium]